MIIVSCDPGLDRVSLAIFAADRIGPHPEHAGPSEKLRTFAGVKAKETAPDLALPERAFRIQTWLRAELRYLQPARFILEVPRVSGIHASRAARTGKTGGGANDDLLRYFIATGVILGAAVAVLGGFGRVQCVKARKAKKETRLQELRQLFASIDRKPSTRNKDDLDAIDVGIWAEWPPLPVR